MYQISETNVDIAELDTDQSTDKIWKKMDQNFNASLPFIESTVDRWNERS